MRLEELAPGTVVSGLLPETEVTVIAARPIGSDVVDLSYRTSDGRDGSQLVYRHDEERLKVTTEGRPWALDGNGEAYRLAAEAYRISLAHLFDPLLAVHTSQVEPLPHQITAVYESMLPRQPLRFLLADDPGAGKTIMAGLLVKELMIRGDVQRCLIVCPGSLVEQWQDELSRRFDLPFEILTNDKLEAARTGNWFGENSLAIARLDKLSRDEDVQAKLATPACHWDLVVCDEAHKMSASFFSGEVKETKRYKLGKLLSSVTRHFLLMTATPHNGKEEDFQLFMALLDGDRFEGRFRDGAHVTDISDLMRRVVKERLYRFDGTRLFPERIAETVSYKLSELEARLYHDVTEYVREEFNRADALENDKRAGTVGFALTILQRRLASSPEAISQSLRRRRERLEKRLRELELLQRGAAVDPYGETRTYDAEALEDLDDASGEEIERAEEEIVDQATAARSIEELSIEIATLKRLEELATRVKRSGEDRKWREVAGLINHVFRPPTNDANGLPTTAPSGDKLVIFTEHRDTLNYLQERIRTLLGQPDAVVVIHGSMGREERLKAQEAFRHDPLVKVLLATDAAGEGINLQRAHLMVNYDLPWNPNRLEQRFGRIHRIGQRNICYLWNLVADETREGDVYRTLLEKLEEARKALGGEVFDVLGKLQFEGRPLRDLLIEAIRAQGEFEPGRLKQVIADAVNVSQLESLINTSALAPEIMDMPRVQKIREEMERANARRLQPAYVRQFFLKAFERLGGTIRDREAGRFEITHVPANIRQRDRLAGRGEPVMTRYDRVCFDKADIAPDGMKPAAFICPGHPLLDAVLSLTLEHERAALRSGTILVDRRDFSTEPRFVFCIDHAIRDASKTPSGDFRVVSKRALYVEIDAHGHARHVPYAPYLDFEPLGASDPGPNEVLSQPECQWITGDIKTLALNYAITDVVPTHIEEVGARRRQWIEKTRAAVHDRLRKEINHWDRRAEELKLQEQAGKPNAKLNSQQARARADDLTARLHARQTQLNLESHLTPSAPNIASFFVVVPAGLLARMSGTTLTPQTTTDTQAVAARAREIVMEIERKLGFVPVDRETEKLGYDIESRDPTGKSGLRFIEVKGRVAGADTVTVTSNEIIFSLNTPENFILAMVEFNPDRSHRVSYLRNPFSRAPDFDVSSVNYEFSKLLARAEVQV